MDQQTEAANGLAVALLARDSKVGTLAAKLNYSGSTDPAALENSARDAIRRIGMSIFDLGGYLLLLRESCPHGEFLPALERLGLGAEAARRYMTITLRFANSSTSRNLEGIGMSKLTELLPLDDEQLGELTDLGQTGELSLDDVATMSVKQLRATVRKLRQAQDGDAKLQAEKSAQIDKLKKDLALIETLPVDEVLVKLESEATKRMRDVSGRIAGDLRQAFIRISDHDSDDHSVFLAGLLGQVQADITSLRKEFKLPDVSTAADREVATEAAQWAPKKG
ncbi:hypothetical protein CKO44_16005 [Rubrivivax gelatinosus]|nr:hypothetical protein [Rubrivivax gelatinosus]MBZ8143199.1 hypothetical protein [Rubrivivax gelatinosus]